MNDRNVRRWASVTAGALVAAAGLRKGGRLGALMSLAGSALGVAALMKYGHQRNVFDQPAPADWEMPRERLIEDAKAFGRSRRRTQELAEDTADQVGEASDESFPASDAPSFTPTTSLGGHDPSRR